MPAEVLNPAPSSAAVPVNILGYIRGQFGLAESARLYAKALLGAGVPVRLYDVDLELPHGWNDRSLDAWIGDDLPYDVSMVFVNPDYLQDAWEKIGRARLHGHYLIACWFWELERIPDSWLPAIAQVDEIMVASEFVGRSFRKVTYKPVTYVPQPLAEMADSGLQRVDFGLEDDRFIFLVTFDFNSWIARKNPYGALQAFIRAFPPARDDVRLLIKSSNGFRHPERFRELLNAASCDPRVIVRDDVIDRAHVCALQRCCDAYVSLHRAEGFGLGLAECMALAKPVIATAWSGNMDFMNQGNSCLVDFKLVPVADGEYPESSGCVWAEADIESAACSMRRLADDPALARELGVAASQDVRRHFSPSLAAERIQARISEVRRTAAC